MPHGLERDYSDQSQNKMFMITYTPSDVINFSEVQYVGFGARGWNVTEALRQVPVAIGGRMKKLNIRVIANSLVDTADFVARKNGADVGPVLQIGAGLTGFFALETNVQFDANDLMNWKITANGGSGSIQIAVTHVIEHDVEDLL